MSAIHNKASQLCWCWHLPERSVDPISCQKWHLDRWMYVFKFHLFVYTQVIYAQYSHVKTSLWNQSVMNIAAVSVSGEPVSSLQCTTHWTSLRQHMRLYCSCWEQSAVAPCTWQHDLHPLQSSGNLPSRGTGSSILCVIWILTSPADGNFLSNLFEIISAWFT